MIPDRRTQAVLIGLLTYDNRGRALVRDVPALNLLAGDRLEPNPRLPDFAGFERLVPPLHVLFWRPQSETLARHRCPIFGVRGVSVQTLAIDMLHCLHIGVFQIIVLDVLVEP